MGFKLRHMFLKASLSLLLVPLTTTAQPQVRTLSIDELFRLGIENSLRMQASRIGGDPGRRTRKKRPQRKAARPECRIVRRLSRAARRFPARIDPSHAPRHPELVEQLQHRPFPTSLRRRENPVQHPAGRSGTADRLAQHRKRPGGDQNAAVATICRAVQPLQAD